MLFRNPFRFGCRPQRRRRVGLAQDIQPLEIRNLPAGTVTAQVVGQSFFLIGDKYSNDLTVAVTSSGIEVTGNGTQIKFGNQTIAPDTPVTITEDLDLAGSFFVNLGKGNDSLVINIAEDAELNISGNLTLFLGVGNDLFEINNSGVLNIDGNIYIDAWSGNDRIEVKDFAPDHINVDGALTILGWSGHDEILIGGNDITIHGPVTINTGSGDDYLCVFENVAMESLLTIDLGSGNDEAILTGTISISGPTTINAGEGNDTVGLIDPDQVISFGNGEGEEEGEGEGEEIAPDAQAVTLGSNLTIFGLGGNDAIGLTGTSIEGSAFIYGGLGGDCIGAFNVTVDGALFVYGEAGNDTIAAYDLTVDGAVVVDAGLDHDVVLVGDVSFGFTVYLQLGWGNDKLIVGEIEIEYPWLTVIDASLGNDKLAAFDLEALESEFFFIFFFDGELSESDAESCVTITIDKFVTAFTKAT